MKKGIITILTVVLLLLSACVDAPSSGMSSTASENSSSAVSGTASGE